MWAASYSVQPTRIELSPRQTNLTVRITNVSDEPTTIQARIVAWTAKGTEEVQVDSEDLLLNPPIFTVLPGKVQFMRVGLRKPQFGPEEVSYRLILDEVPPPPKPDFQGVRTLLRLSVPIFVSQPGTQAALQWSAQRVDDSTIKLTAVNRGKAHVQIKNLSVTVAGRPEPDVVKPASDYVLRTGSKEWLLHNEHFQGATQFSLDAKTDAKDLHESIEVLAH